MTNTDYIGRVEQAIRDSLVGNAQIVGLVEWEVTEREGYWERIYIVAWGKEARPDQPNTDGKTFGTHRVCIDSKGQTGVFIGHYDMTRRDALGDMAERAGLSVGRI